MNYEKSFHVKCVRWLNAQNRNKNVNNADDDDDEDEAEQCNYPNSLISSDMSSLSDTSSSKSSSPKRLVSIETKWLSFLKCQHKSTISKMNLLQTPTKTVAWNYFVEFQKLQLKLFQNAIVSRNCDMPLDQLSMQLTRQEWNLQINALYSCLIAESTLIKLPDEKLRNDFIRGLNSLEQNIIDEIEIFHEGEAAVSSTIQATTTADG